MLLVYLSDKDTKVQSLRFNVHGLILRYQDIGLSDIFFLIFDSGNCHSELAEE